MSDAVDLGAVRQAQQKTWSEGDFAMVAGLVEMVAEELVEALDIVPDERVLDVACGSGNGALAAARRAWGNTVGVDFVPALLERGRERAAAERLDVEFVEGDAAELPFERRRVRRRDLDLRRDVRARPARRRQPSCCASASPAAGSAWPTGSPTAVVGKMFKTIAKHAPPPPGMVPADALGHRGPPARAVRRRDLRPAGRAPQVPPGIPLRRPLPRVLPHLLRPDQGRLRAGRPGGRGGADGRPAGLPRTRTTRPATGRWCSNPSTCRWSRRGPRRSAREDAQRRADEQHREEDHAGHRAALPEGVGDRHRGEGQEEGHDHSHAAGILAAAPGRQRVSRRKAPTASAAASGEPASPAARTRRLPMITPSAISPTSAACSGVPMPKPTATGTSASALAARDQLGELRRELVALPGRADRGDDVDEALGGGADAGAALGRGGRRDQRNERQAGCGERLAHLLGLLQRQVGDDRPRGARGRAPRGELLGPALGQDHVGVDHQDDRNPVGDRLADLKRRLERRPGLERRASRRRGSSAHRQAGRRTAPQARSGRRRVGVGLGHRQRRFAIGKASHHVGHQRRPAFAARARSKAAAIALDPGRGHLSHRSAPGPRRGPCRHARRGRARRSPRRHRSPAARRSRARTRAPG